MTIESEIAVSTFTFAGSLNPLKYVGCRVTLIDSEPVSWNLDPGLLEQECQSRVAAGRRQLDAVLVVDLYGQPANYDDIEAVTTKFGVRLLSDAAESLGALYKGRPAGSFGEWAALSFNGNKIITTGGGGAFVTDDPIVAERVRYLATQARQPVAHYEHVEVGYNYRLSNLLAALGRGQLENLSVKIARRKEIEEHYKKDLGSCAGVSFMPHPIWSQPNRWLTCLTLDPQVVKKSPNEVRECLEAENIESRQLWKPMHQQQVFADLPARLNGVSDGLFATGLCLPSGSSMTEEQQTRVIRAFQRVIG
jgi:pyridoxal phosphate-dependent aminotransferase EpsN